MLVTTTHQLMGYTITEYIGVVQGVTTMIMKAKQTLKGQWSMCKSLGGENDHFTEFHEEVRKKALEKMISEAKGLGADMIIGMLYDCDHKSGEGVIVTCYGTAVKVERSID